MSLVRKLDVVTDQLADIIKDNPNEIDVVKAQEILLERLIDLQQNNST